MSAAQFRFLAPMPCLASRPEEWATSLREIEDLGFHSVAVSEHYSHGWAMDALTATNFALASTTRLRAMPLVLNNDLHHPARLAKAIATADLLSAGRVALGLGAGWLEDDYRALGVGYDPAQVRISRLEEAVRIILAFFAGGGVTFTGEHYKLDNLEALPSPTQSPHPPVLIGGGGPRMLALAGSYADIVGVQMRLGRGGFDESAAEELSRRSIDAKLALATAGASGAGRPVPDFQFTCYDVNIGGIQVTPPRPQFSAYVLAHRARLGDSPVSLTGDVSKCVDDLRRWNAELGISYWHLGPDVQAVAPIVAQLSNE